MVGHKRGVRPNPLEPPLRTRMLMHIFFAPILKIIFRRLCSIVKSVQQVQSQSHILVQRAAGGKGCRRRTKLAGRKTLILKNYINRENVTNPETVFRPVAG